MNMKEIIYNINKLETQTEQLEIYAEDIIKQIRMNRHTIQEIKNEIDKDVYLKNNMEF